jgi:hypothetical protein
MADLAARPTRRPVTAPPDGAHEWVSFPDPKENRTWIFDATFLLSSWECIYGRGCQGVLTGPSPELAQGCCSYGAHFTGADDVARVERAAARLRDDEWQFAAKGRTKSGKLRVVRVNKDGETVSRLAEGACIFLNRPGFAGGPGCALHSASVARGRRPMDDKPDVCWQVPLRREDQTDSTGHVVSTVSQWDRRHWGAGGDDFHWWCTEAPEAFVGVHPVYQAMRDELKGLVGAKVYAIVAAELDRRRATGMTLSHPTVAVAPPRLR